MKIYIINLDRAPERMAHMIKLIEDNNLQAERYGAFDANNFSDADLQKLKLIGLPAGDAACSTSQLGCLKLIANGDDQYGTILEDDLYFSSDAKEYLTKTDWIPEHTDVVKLETVRSYTLLDKPVKKMPNNRIIAQLLSQHNGAGAYIVSKDAAKRIIQEYSYREGCIDAFIFGQKLDEFNVYQISPAIAIQQSIAKFKNPGFANSYIVGTRRPNETKKLPLTSKIAREVKRVFFTIKNYFKRLYTKVTTGRTFGKVPYKH